MTAQEALEKREQMTRDGYCVIDDILSDQFLHGLRVESERLMADWVPPVDFRYQGQHVGVKGADNASIRKLLDWPPSRSALEQMGYGDFASVGSIIILTKDPEEPALFWHQDWMQWHDPMSLSPWPQIIFLNYYLQDTAVENGCLKVIPGTHRRRIDLHDQLVPAHEQGARFIAEDHAVMFSDHPEQVDVAVEAGSLVLADARLLHSAYRNRTAERRTLILAWHKRPLTVPDYWQGEVPAAIANRDPGAEYPGSRIPGAYLT